MSDNVITIEKTICVDDFSSKYNLSIEKQNDLYKNSLFFDLEHYIYKKPICLGVFGCCYYEERTHELKVTQYMIENEKEAIEILYLAKAYFDKMILRQGKKHIVTFSGNNDFVVINYLFNKYNIDFKLEDNFNSIDLQKQYEKETGCCVGLKALEKEFGIIRESELISGSNLAKTFQKIMKDEEYGNRMPKEKKEKILLYNEQDVVSLFHMYVNWNRVEKSKGKILNCPQ